MTIKTPGNGQIGWFLLISAPGQGLVTVAESCHPVRGTTFFPLNIHCLWQATGFVFICYYSWASRSTIRRSSNSRDGVGAHVPAWKPAEVQASRTRTEITDAHCRLQKFCEFSVNKSYRIHQITWQFKNIYIHTGFIYIIPVIYFEGK